MMKDCTDARYRDTRCHHEYTTTCAACCWNTNNIRRNMRNRSQTTKQDEGKPRWELVPMKALEGIPLVMADAIEPKEGESAGRYKENSWQIVDPRRYFAALVRHVIELQEGKGVTDDTGMNTIDAILTNAMFLRYFQLKGTLPCLTPAFTPTAPISAAAGVNNAK